MVSSYTGPALQDVLRSYDALQMCFEDFAQSSGACHAKANGIAVFLGKSLSYLGIYVSLLVSRRAKQVSRRLQQRGIMLKAAMDAVSELREYYVQLRTDESREEIWKHVISKSELDLETPQLTRVRRPSTAPRAGTNSNCYSALPVQRCEDQAQDSLFAAN